MTGRFWNLLNRSFILTGMMVMLVCATAGAQNVFSGKLDKFPRELESWLAKTDRSRTDKVIKPLEVVWESGYYDNEAKQMLIERANRLVELKMHNFPDLANLVETFINFPESELDIVHLKQYFYMIDGYMAGRKTKKQLSTLLKFGPGFFKKGTLNLTPSKSAHWKVDNYNYHYENGEEPALVFDQVRLVCTSKGSFIDIKRTSGVYYPLRFTWEGNGGEVTYERAGISPDEVNIKLREYKIDMRKADYKADSVIYTNSEYFSEPLLGSLYDKVMVIKSPDKAKYPMFKSYFNVNIHNIIDKVDFKGSFAQEGAQLVGTETQYGKTKLTIYRENKPFMIVSSNRFLIKMKNVPENEDERKWWQRKKETSRQARNRIVSSNARVVILMDGDSIMHPGLKFALFTDERLVSLVRIKGDMSETPYLNTYHNIEMRFELLNWKIDDPIMEFGSYKWSSDKTGIFESKSYFKKAQYERLMGAGSWYPLAYLKKCSDDWDTTKLMSSQIAQTMGIPVAQVEPMLLRYTVMGYLDFDEETKVATLHEKLFHQVAAFNKKEDYDIIKIYSVADETTRYQNASLNLLNYDLTIMGVNRILLSDSHNVVIFPDERKIVMHRDRDFDFDGLVSSGKVEFFGSNFKFFYDEFKITMPIIDSIQLWVSTNKRDKQGYLLEARVRTVIEGGEGELEVDRPNNKSGLKVIPEYPIFTSFVESYAFYDSKAIYNGVYDRNDFYFQLDPFIIDSLDHFSNEGIRFGGTFVSAGIFPEIDETLRLQEDYSLGFKQKTPKGGYEAYGGVGTFENEIQLSNKGLRGNGTIKYLTSTAVSDEFLFFPKEVNGVTRLFEIEEQMAKVEYPNVSADTIEYQWLPYRDTLKVRSMPQHKPINMFAGVVEHTGELQYSPKGLTGSGKSSFEGANLYSDLMKFTFFKINADTADFELGTDLLDALDFSSSNVKAEIDFNERFGDFVSNTGGSLTVFEQCMYQAYLDRFTWFMDAAEVEFSAEGKMIQKGSDELQLEGAEFVSRHPDQDSLRFFAKSATYSLIETRITAKDVEFINVADAEIHPSDGFVIIHKKAKMDTLLGATIIANRELRYHKIYDADVTISSKWMYKSAGKYDYKDENGLLQTIDLYEVSVDTSRQTYDLGILTAEDGFTLSPMYSFKGDVELKANRRNLTFSGYGRINHDCKDVPATWFSFESEVDPEDIVITIDSTISNEAGNKLISSLMIPRDSSILYGAFLSKPISRSDIAVNPATGYLDFNSATREYRISNIEKLNERSFPGNYVALNTKTCVLDGEGRLELARKTGLVKVTTIGNYKLNTINHDVNFETVMLIDFLIDDNALGLIMADILESELDPVEIDRPVYEVALRELLGIKKADDMIGKLNLGKSVRLPDQLRSTFFFNDVKFIWNKETESFMSKGKIGIGNITKEPVNFYVDGGIELIPKRTGTDIVIYLEVSPGSWYIFSYKASTGYMRVYSSNKEFMKVIMDVKDSNRKLTGEKGTRPYIYTPGSKRQRSEFLRRFDGI